MHKKGARIKVLKGTHQGKLGMIVKVNLVKHTVAFDNGESGFVQRSYCYFLENDSIERSHTDGRIPSRATRLSVLTFEYVSLCPSNEHYYSGTNIYFYF
jgi:hypothetical protein